MSEQNKKTIEGMYEAFGSGDIASVIGALDPMGRSWLFSSTLILCSFRKLWHKLGQDYRIIMMNPVILSKGFFNS
jgi:hypothetical protein